MRRLAALLLLAVAAKAEPVDEILFRARYAQQVEGDLETAVALYHEALKDTSLGVARQARIRLRLAQCYARLDEVARALDPYLVETIYAHDDVEPEVRRKAAELRAELRQRLPAPVTKPPSPPVDQAAERRAKARQQIARARGFRDADDEVRAYVAVQTALELDPGNEEATALLADIETRMSGVADFLRDPLRFVRTWSEARITDVAQRAATLLQQGIEQGEAGHPIAARTAFGKALEILDATEFIQVSDRLAELRASVAEHWRAMRSRAGLEPPDIPEPPTRPSSLSAEYLQVLERMLAVVSSPEREYRIMPVHAAAVPAGGAWQQTPDRYRLFRELPSEWSPAHFARYYLRRGIAPRSWHERGNYLEAAGGMLVARNKPAVLDALLEAVQRMERPVKKTLPGRFLLVSVSDDAVRSFEKRFGGFAREGTAAAPALVGIVPPRFSLDYLCSFLRDQGADVDLERDTFRAGITNGAPQVLFAAAPLTSAPGYFGFHVDGGDILATHFGVLVDVYPLRNEFGATSLGMRVTARRPAPRVAGVARFVEQHSEFFADIAPGATLVVAGLLDPFASDPDHTLLLLWENADPDAAAAPPPEGVEGPGAEVPLRRLLIDVADDPGPRLDAEQGYVRRDAIDVLRERAGFLERLLRTRIGPDEKDDGTKVDIEEAVVRVPPARREEAAALVAQLERESARSYVVQIQTRAVRTAVLQRWMKREELEQQRFGSAYLALSDRKQLVSGTEPPDVFAPALWAKVTCRGLQARHGLSTRTRTSPAYRSEAELAKGATRTVTEGTRITVRPYAWEGRLWLDVDIQTGALESEVEEMALDMPVPSHRTRLGGTHIVGTIDLGDWKRPQTAILTNIPHPTASRPDKVTEIAISLSVRPVP